MEYEEPTQDDELEQSEVEVEDLEVPDEDADEVQGGMRKSGGDPN